MTRRTLGPSRGCAAPRVNRRHPEQGRFGLAALLWLLAAAVHAQGSELELSHALVPVDPPLRAPDFTLTDMDDEPRAISDYRGKVVLLNFWATWCPPCRKEMPSMEALYQELQDRPFTVLAVNQWEDSDHVFAFLGQLDVFPTFPILFDPQSEIAEAYGVIGLPTSFVLDKAGRVVYQAKGGRDFSHPEVKATIRALLDQSESDLEP